MFSCHSPDKQGEKHDYPAATREKDFAFIYTCDGRTMNIDPTETSPHTLKAFWYNPRNGQYSVIGSYRAMDIRSLDPPGEQTEGNEWILVLDCVKKG